MTRAIVDHPTPNHVVAYNLRRARLLRGWSQALAARVLSVELGRPWSTSAVSVAERSALAPRARRFDATEVVAFARVFGVGVRWFFRAPSDDAPPTPPRSAARHMARSLEALTRALGIGDVVGVDALEGVVAGLGRHPGGEA